MVVKTKLFYVTPSGSVSPSPSPSPTASPSPQPTSSPTPPPPPTFSPSPTPQPTRTLTVATRRQDTNELLTGITITLKRLSNGQEFAEDSTAIFPDLPLFENYTVTASDGPGFVFANWDTSSTNRTRSFFYDQESLLVAFYLPVAPSPTPSPTSSPSPSPTASPPPPSTILIRVYTRENVASTPQPPINGIPIDLLIHATSETITMVSSPADFTVPSGGTYTITANDTAEWEFDHWDTGITNRSITLTNRTTPATRVAFYNPVVPPPATPPPIVPAFTFSTTGDIGCKSASANVITQIASRNKQHFIGLGDYCYAQLCSQTGLPPCCPDCFFQTALQIEDKVAGMVFTDDDVEELQALMTRYNIPDIYYSLNIGKVHFIFLTNLESISEGSGQYNFFINDLESAYNDPNIDFIIPCTQHVMVFPPTTVSPQPRKMNQFWPIYEQYKSKLCLVLQAGYHVYWRSFPVSHNPSDVPNPIVESTDPEYYEDVDGIVFTMVALGGDSTQSITGLGANNFTKIQLNNDFGSLDVHVFDQPTFKALECTFYGINTGIRDKFTILKNK